MIKDRAFNALNLEQYSKINKADKLGYIELSVPIEEQYILRMLIKKMFNGYMIPQEIQWLQPFIEKCEAYQKSMGINQPFVYITIRNGIVKSVTDDEWHVDGFSKTITHLPEQNYIWSNKIPTEYIEKAIEIPHDFNPLKHNIHKFFQKRISETDIKMMNEKKIYCLDPYIIHKRPKIEPNVNRCFIRLSFTPIEIEDVNNTINPLLVTNYTRNGVMEMRDQLIEYDN